MGNLAKLSLKSDEGLYRVVVETPRGETRKIDYDDETKCFFVKRRLPLGLAYPFHFGFLPSTLGDDGDPLDAIVLSLDTAFPGLVFHCRIVAVLQVEQREGAEKAKRNDRFIAVADHDLEHTDMENVDDLPRKRRKEIEQFLAGSVKLEPKKVKFLGWDDAKEAASLIQQGMNKAGRSNRKKA